MNPADEVFLAFEDEGAGGPLFDVVPIDDLEHVEPPAPVFLWEHYIPRGVVTLLAAHGGTGKSTLAMMLCVCVALGKPLFGKPVQQGRALFFSAEDPAPLLRYRLKFIARAMGVDLAALAGRVHIVDATAGEPVLFHAVTSKAGRTTTTTPTFSKLAEFVTANAVDLVVIDNASDVFEANEIARVEVRRFVRALAGMGDALAVLLLAHLDKAAARGLASGGDAYSGSTAWHNSARSRLFLAREKDNGGMTLEHQKANLAAKLQPPLRLVWPEGGVIVVDAPVSGFVRLIADDNNAKALLKLIHEFTLRGEFVSTATTSRSHAGKLLRRERSFPPRLPDAELFDALRQAERRGLLNRETYRGADRKDRERWQVTDSGAAFAGIAATAATAATSDSGASGASGAEPAATAATSPPRGVGGRARTQVAAKPGDATP